MDYVTLEHDLYDLRQPLAVDEILHMCRRAFGHGTEVESARELDGGEHNTTYLVRLAGMDSVILRVAPPPEAHLFWDEEALMRREQTIQPYFAPIATLLPRTLMIDFTRQVIDRDYMFQTYMHGEPWSEDDDLTPAEDESLWRQFARIARAIHSVEGEAFGFPYPGPRFATWSQTVLYVLKHTVAEIEVVGLDTDDIQAVLGAAEDNTAALDEIARPRLSHGDLWPFNVLIGRGDGGLSIVAVIDADRAWWCDPMADWTAHLFRIKTAPRMSRRREVFWDEYGPPEQSPGAERRELIYDGMHSGTILAWSTAHHKDNIATDARVRLHAVTTALAALSL